jgi:cyclic pyranopterin phosphate synthase
VLRVQASNSGGLFRDILLKPMDKLQAFEFDGTAPKRGLIDPFGRAISYLRVSVTDRCDFRCVYCMAENMSFLPKSEILTLE